MHPDDAAERGVIEEDDTVRVYNALGEVHCLATVTPTHRARHGEPAQGPVAVSTFNGATANALVPDTLTDLGGGACFNDARVEVTRLVSAELGAQRLAFWVAEHTRH